MILHCATDLFLKKEKKNHSSFDLLTSQHNFPLRSFSHFVNLKGSKLDKCLCVFSLSTQVPKGPKFTSGLLCNICGIFGVRVASDDLLNPGETQELQSCNLYQWKRSGIPHKSSQTRMQSLIYEDGHVNTPVGPFSPSGHFGFGDEEIKQLCWMDRDTSHIKQFDQ